MACKIFDDKIIVSPDLQLLVWSNAMGLPSKFLVTIRGGWSRHSVLLRLGRGRRANGDCRAPAVRCGCAARSRQRLQPNKGTMMSLAGRGHMGTIGRPGKAWDLYASLSHRTAHGQIDLSTHTFSPVLLSWSEKDDLGCVICTGH